MNSRVLVGFALTVSITGAACGGGKMDQAPSLASAQPDLVCGEQLTTGVKLVGDRFVATPAITLERTEDLSRAPAGGSATVGAGQVRFGTAQLISFDVSAALALAPGRYDVRVRNPDRQQGTLPGGLTVVPRPTADALDIPAACVAQAARTLTVTGRGILEAGPSGSAMPVVTIGGADLPATASTGCVLLHGPFADGDAALCTGVLVTIPQGALAAGDHAVTVTNPSPAACASTDALSLHVEDPPTVSDVLPRFICSSGGALGVSGTGLTASTAVRLAAAGVPTLPTETVSVAADHTQASATVGPGAVPGVAYDVLVDDGIGCVDAAPHQQVTAVPSPVPFLVDPAMSREGVATAVEVYASQLMPPLPLNAVTIVPTGQSGPAITLPSSSTVPGHPNRVQAVLPANVPAGVYDLQLTDATGCGGTLARALTVTNTAGLSLASVSPSFAYTGADATITVRRDSAAPAPGDHPFVATPRVFLTALQATDAAIELKSVSFVDADTLRAVVPAGGPAGLYAVVVVNPVGTSAILANAFAISAQPGPTISSVSPASITGFSGQTVHVAGETFVSPTVSLGCVAGGAWAGSPSIVTGTPSCSGTLCTVSATIDASTLIAGAICVLRVTNADGTYAEHSAVAVSSPSLNLNATAAGPDLNVGRRALVAMAGDAAPGARFVYAAGGDDGSTMGAYDSIEFAPVGAFGELGPWRLVPRSTMNVQRAFAAGAAVGRYLYVVGGNDGTGPVDSAERAMILSPDEAPRAALSDLFLSSSGLAAGDWLYQVAAILDATDPDNPGGESLPSEEVIARVPTLADGKARVVLTWTPPPLPNVAGYRIYRTPAANGPSGGEVLLAIVPVITQSFTDDGSSVPGNESPLPLGSVGNWAMLPSLGSKRAEAALTVAPDPLDPTELYVYALLGRSSPTTALASYEYLPVTVSTSGRHSAALSWSPGGSPVATARSQLGAWAADATVSSTIAASDTWIYLGGGLTSALSPAQDVDAGRVHAGGDLGTFSALPKDFGVGAAGYGTCTGNGQLFTFGGSGAAPSSSAKAAMLITPPPSLATSSWNDAGLTLVHARYLMGTAAEKRPFVFVVGGQTDDPTAASKSTEGFTW